MYGLLTEPGERSTVFTIYASESGAHSWVVIQVNFKDFLGKFFICQMLTLTI